MSSQVTSSDSSLGARYSPLLDTRDVAVGADNPILDTRDVAVGADNPKKVQGIALLKLQEPWLSEARKLEIEYLKERWVFSTDEDLERSIIEMNADSETPYAGSVMKDIISGSRYVLGLGALSASFFTGMALEGCSHSEDFSNFTASDLSSCLLSTGLYLPVINDIVIYGLILIALSNFKNILRSGLDAMKSLIKNRCVTKKYENAIVAKIEQIQRLDALEGQRKVSSKKK